MRVINWVFGLFLTLSLGVAHAADWSHATALNGTPKYAAGFSHFDYVNPNAPKGGQARLAVVGSYDTLNPVPDKGQIASGMTLVFETLMTSSLDELPISAEYGLLAEAISYPDDFSSVSFRLNQNAKWHDGVAVTPEDVIFSFDAIKQHSAIAKQYYANVIKAEKTGPFDVTFTFDMPGNRELPHIMGQISIYPKHWWEGTDEKGQKRDIGRGTLEKPLGSGPYRVSAADQGRAINFERVENYWGKELNVNIGSHNFDRLRFDYYRDSTVVLEAFKADAFDFRTENSARSWATGYEGFPARDKGYVKLEALPDEARGGMQAYVVNLRRDKFKDQRVRRALNLAYDFESANKATYYNLYFRNKSYFDGTELAATGLPEGLELDILKQVKAKFPDGFADTVFTAPYTNPVGGDDTKIRANLREAIKLFKEAGYEVKDGKLVDSKTSEPFTIEFLYYQPDGDRQVQFFRNNLEKIGVTFNIRVVDTSAYVERLRDFDYDMIIGVWGQSLSPGNEQREYWGSSSVSQPGSRNYAGIGEPVIDELINRIVFAKERAQLVAATKALDRVLLSKEFMVPQISYPFTRIAYWTRFGHPEPLPKYAVGFPAVWWFDEAKAAAIVK